MESGFVDGEAELCGDTQKAPILVPLVPDVDPDASPRVERNRLEYCDKIADVFSHGGFSSQFTGAGSIAALLIIGRRGDKGVHFCLQCGQNIDGVTTKDKEWVA